MPGKNVTISKHPQLFDLNGDITNFDLKFSVTSIDNNPFYVVVVDQQELDENPDNLQWKSVTDKNISGNIVSDKNIHKNYLLCVKSDVESNVNIEIEKTEIPPNIPPPPPQQPIPLHPRKEMFANYGDHKPTMGIAKKDDITSSSNFNMILLVVAIGVIGYFAYSYFFDNKQPTTATPPSVSMIDTGDSSSSAASSPSPYKTSAPNSELLAKIKNLSFH